MQDLVMYIEKSFPTIQLFGYLNILVDRAKVPKKDKNKGEIKILLLPLSEWDSKNAKSRLPRFGSQVPLAFMTF